MSGRQSLQRKYLYKKALAKRKRDVDEAYAYLEKEHKKAKGPLQTALSRVMTEAVFKPIGGAVTKLFPPRYSHKEIEDFHNRGVSSGPRVVSPPRKKIAGLPAQSSSNSLGNSSSLEVKQLLSALRAVGRSRIAQPTLKRRVSDPDVRSTTKFARVEPHKVERPGYVKVTQLKSPDLAVHRESKLESKAPLEEVTSETKVRARPGASYVPLNASVSGSKIRNMIGIAQRSHSTTASFKMKSVGEDLVITGCDRLDPVLLDPARNTSGSLLAEYKINPALMGERLRRLSSCFENYAFLSGRMIYDAASPTITAGSMLGFFDQDPTDTFDAGISSLKDAAAHPFAATVKVWENGVFVMPKRLNGRFYIESRGTDAASRRLQEQGTFRFLLDVPFNNTLAPPMGQPLILGSVYFQYVIRLMKPCIQNPFPGGCDVYSTTLSDTPFNVTPITGVTGTVISPQRGTHAVAPLLADPENNAGTAMLQATDDAPYSVFRLQPALYNVEMILHESGLTKGTPGTTDLAYFFCSINSTPTNTYSPAGVGRAAVGDYTTAAIQHESKIPWDVASTASFGPFVGNTNGAWDTPRTFNFSSTILIPEGPPQYLAPYLWFRNVGGSTLSYKGVTFRFTVLRQTPAEKALSSVTVLSSLELSARVKRIEALLVDDEDDETGSSLSPATSVSLSSVPVSSSSRAPST